MRMLTTKIVDYSSNARKFQVFGFVSTILQIKAQSRYLMGNKCLVTETSAEYAIRKLVTSIATLFSTTLFYLFN